MPTSTASAWTSTRRSALPSETCIVTSAEKKLVDAIDEAIQRVVDGTAVGGSVVLDAASDPPKVGTSAFHNHPDLLTPELQTLLDDATAAMASGELDPCAGEGECPDSTERSVGQSV